MPADISMLDWSLRLVAAALLSGLVGFEREAQQKAAGLRTHMLVGFGAALFTLVGAYAFENSDASRVAAQVVTGVGFLGAGAIFRTGSTVSGLTTAAGLWAVAAIGMAAGAGLVVGAVVATAITFAILYGLGVIEHMLRRRRSAGVTRPLAVHVTDLSELTEIVKMTCTLDEEARQIGVDKTDGAEFLVTFNLRPDRITTVTAALGAFESVIDAAEIDPK